MRNEGLVTRNDEIRSELQLTNDRLALREARNDICIVSQQLDVVLGLDETLLIAPRHRIAVHSSSGGELPEVRRTGLCELSGIENRAGKYLIGPE